MSLDALNPATTADLPIVWDDLRFEPLLPGKR
jgi:hypothetical protein